MTSRVFAAMLFFAFSLTTLAQEPMSKQDDKVAKVAICNWVGSDAKQVYIMDKRQLPQRGTAQFYELAKELDSKAGVEIITSGTMGITYKLKDGNYPLNMLDVLNNYFHPQGGVIKVVRPDGLLVKIGGACGYGSPRATPPPTKMDTIPTNRRRP